LWIGRTLKKNCMSTYTDIWGRLHLDQETRERELGILTKLKSSLEQKQIQDMATVASSRLQTARQPDPAILLRAKTRRELRNQKCMSY